MGDGSETKRQLGKIVLQRRPVVDESSEIEAEERPTRPSSLDQDPRLLLLTLRDSDDVRSIDLRRVVIQLDVLSYVPAERAHEKQLLPLAVDPERLLVVMSDPSERALLEQLAHESGRSVFACVPADGSLRDLIDRVYGASRAGATVYTGPLARTSEESSFSFAPQPSFASTLETVRSPAKPTVALPALRTFSLSSEGTPTVPAPKTQSARRRLLLAEPSEPARVVLRRALSDYEVFESATGPDALQCIRDHEPEIVVLDALLPEIHGFDLCRRIKSSRRYGNIPIVMMSDAHRGWRIAEDLRRSYGVAEFFEKPARNEELGAAVARVLSGEAPEPSDALGPGASYLESALASYGSGELERAIAQLKQGIAAEPRGFLLRYHLGLLYGKQGNVFEAIQALESAVELKPRDFASLKNLGVLYQQAGFRLKAVESWERALGAAPDEDTGVSIRNHLMSLL